MKDMFGLRISRKEAHRRGAFVGTVLRGEPGAGKQPVIGRSVLPPALVPIRDVRQFYAQHRCLNGIHGSVPSKFVVVVAPRTAMVAQSPHVLGHVRTGSGNDSRVSVGAQVFGGIETESGSYAKRARSAPAPLGRSEERRVGKEGRSRWSPYH